MRIHFGVHHEFRPNLIFSVSTWLNRRSPNIDSKYANLSNYTTWKVIDFANQKTRTD
jgi:hypothetical protein